MKKLISLIAFFTFFTSFLFTAYAEFNDVPETHKNYDGINYVQSQGIVQGYEDGTYKPDALINRAEFTKIIIESSYDDGTIESCDIENTLTFSDTPADQWYAKYICVAKENSVIEGYPDGTFKPAGDIIYAEASKILVKTFGYVTQELTSEYWYEKFVRVLDIKNTAPDSILVVDQLITRGEMAEMIYRLKNNITDKTSTKFFEVEEAVVAGELTEALLKTALGNKFPGTDFTETTVGINESTANYASGFMVDAGGGSDLYVANTSGGWVIISMVMGGDFVYCSAIEGYDFPVTMIPTCFDEVLGEVVNR